MTAARAGTSNASREGAIGWVVLIVFVAGIAGLTLRRADAAHYEV